MHVYTSRESVLGCIVPLQLHLEINFPKPFFLNCFNPHFCNQAISQNIHFFYLAYFLQPVLESKWYQGGKYKYKYEVLNFCLWDYFD